MDKKQFLLIARNFFKEKGCQIIKNSRFIYQSEAFDVEFQMMHSNFGEYYYLSYYFYSHGMGSYYPTSDECASGRVSDLMSTPEIYYLDIEQDDFSKRLERVFDEELKPISTKPSFLSSSAISSQVVYSDKSSHLEPSARSLHSL